MNTSAGSSERRLSNTVKPADMGLEEWQTELRRLWALHERFDISETDERFSPGEYRVRNPRTRRQYEVAYHGAYSPWNYCSCPDFRTSGLGTCKHVEAVKLWLKAQGKEAHSEMPGYSCVYVNYYGQRSIRLRIGSNHRSEMTSLASEYFDQGYVLRSDALLRFDTFIEKARAIDPAFRCHPDALEEIIGQRERLARAELVDRICTDQMLDSLLTLPLYPYQKQGVRFALKAGKAVIADEMGLGKTVQAIAVAETYLGQKMAESVLIVCPASLKYQWKSEIERYTCRKDVVLVEGYASRRPSLYKAEAPYKIVSYQSLAADIKTLDRIATDLLIMDEVQRLKNWNTWLAQAVRRIDAHYSVLLSGTPLENKLDELVSIVQLVDPYCLSPLYRFRYEHIATDPASGKVIGYKNLGDIREKLSGTLLRRTKQSVRLELPGRTDQFLLIPMTPEQTSRHEQLRGSVARLVSKWQRTNALSEEERRRLLLMLGQMRMLADSTFVLDQNPEEHHDTKVAELMNILGDALEGSDTKVVVFSEWERMARLVSSELSRHGICHEFLSGSIPSQKREDIIRRFQEDPQCRVFLSTDTGSTGLNLQVASLVVNLDLPWNPAVLEQRVGRIYRIGQETPIQVLSLVSKDSIEESMIERLRFKQSLSEGALDGGDDTIFLSDERFRTFMESLSSSSAHAPNFSPEEERLTRQDSALSGDDGKELEPKPEPEQSASPDPSVRNLLVSLRDILRSPEKTRQLEEAITRIIER